MVKIIGMELFGVLIVENDSRSLEIQIVLKNQNYGTPAEFVAKLKKEIQNLDAVESIEIANY